MKLTKTEKAAILLTFLFLVFTLGVHWGTGRVRDSFTISTQTEASARQAVSGETLSDALPADTAEVAGAAAEDEAPQDAAKASGKININTAGQDELMRLDGIGEKLAGRIIAYREENGAFARIEDITRVSGIGEVTYMGICEDITVE